MPNAEVFCNERVKEFAEITETKENPLRALKHVLVQGGRAIPGEYISREGRAGCPSFVLQQCTG